MTLFKTKSKLTLYIQLASALKGHENTLISYNNTLDKYSELLETAKSLLKESEQHKQENEQLRSAYELAEQEKAELLQIIRWEYGIYPSERLREILQRHGVLEPKQENWTAEEIMRREA
jgi:hypothetical protein